MDIISAVKRLERAGDENSKATKKLHEAAYNVAQLIIKIVPLGVKLPRGYKVRHIKSNVGSADFLTYWQPTPSDKAYSERPDLEGETMWIDGQGSYLHGDFNAWIPNQTRAGSLKFAKDVAEGLLEEIAEFLEKRKAESEEATSALAVAVVAQVKGE